jgi:hypothetical protein
LLILRGPGLGLLVTRWRVWRLGCGGVGLGSPSKRLWMCSGLLVRNLGGEGGCHCSACCSFAAWSSRGRRAGGYWTCRDAP